MRNGVVLAVVTPCWIHFSDFLDLSKTNKREKILAGKINNEKNRNGIENCYLLWWSDKKRNFHFNSHGQITDHFMNAFNDVTSPHVFSYCSLQCRRYFRAEYGTLDKLVRFRHLGLLLDAWPVEGWCRGGIGAGVGEKNNACPQSLWNHWTPPN